MSHLLHVMPRKAGKHCFIIRKQCSNRWCLYAFIFKKIFIVPIIGKTLIPFISDIKLICPFPASNNMEICLTPWIMPWGKCSLLYILTSHWVLRIPNAGQNMHFKFFYAKKLWKCIFQPVFGQHPNAGQNIQQLLMAWCHLLMFSFRKTLSFGKFAFYGIFLANWWKLIWKINIKPKTKAKYFKMITVNKVV